MAKAVKLIKNIAFMIKTGWLKMQNLENETKHTEIKSMTQTI
jgi:hypothetical protein